MIDRHVKRAYRSRQMSASERIIVTVGQQPNSAFEKLAVHPFSYAQAATAVEGRAREVNQVSGSLTRVTKRLAELTAPDTPVYETRLQQSAHHLGEALLQLGQDCQKLQDRIEAVDPRQYRLF